MPRFVKRACFRRCINEQVVESSDPASMILMRHKLQEAESLHLNGSDVELGTRKGVEGSITSAVLIF